MNYRWITLALLPLFLSLSVSADNTATEADVVFPQRLDAEALLLTCNASAITNRGRENRRYCSGFISGVEELARLLRDDTTGGSASQICMPPTTSARELRDMYSRYAKQHADMLSQPAALVVLRALQQAYPCQKKKPAG